MIDERNAVTDCSPDALMMSGSRVRGCVLGGALGDALGAPIEFSSLDSIRRRYGPAGISGLVPDRRGEVGLVTDDTQMTVFTLEGILRAHVRMTNKGICHLPSVVRFAYLRWLDTQRHDTPPPGGGAEYVFRTGRLRDQRWLYAQRAPGTSCLSGLHAEPGRAAPFGEPGPVNPGSKGCGTVMRSAPFGLGAGSARRAFETAEAETFLAQRRIGPLEGFRSKAGWPFTAELKLAYDDEIANWKLEFDFGDEAKAAGESGEPVDFSGQESLGACPKCKGHVYEHGTSYVCEHSVGAHVTCDFKSGKIILQQPVAREQMTKLLATGKTDLLENFVSNKTRRKFKARLAWDAKEGKVSFEFEPRALKVGAAKKAPAKRAVAKKAA